MRLDWMQVERDTLSESFYLFHAKPAARGLSHVWAGRSQQCLRHGAVVTFAHERLQILGEPLARVIEPISKENVGRALTALSPGLDCPRCQVSEGLYLGLSQTIGRAG